MVKEDDTKDFVEKSWNSKCNTLVRTNLACLRKKISVYLGIMRERDIVGKRRSPSQTVLRSVDSPVGGATGWLSWAIDSWF